MTSFFIRACLSAALLTMAAADAHAAFEFVPPAQSRAMSEAPTQPAPRAMTMTPAPAADVVREALSSAGARTSPQSLLPAAPAMPRAALAPQIQQRPQTPGGMPVINMNPLAVQGMAGADTAPARVEQAMAQGGGFQPVPMVQTSSYGRMPVPAAQAANGFNEAIGFGRDLPLALAVSQIVPPDYAFSFGQSVNPGDTVSWEGGKPWDQVLNDALGRAGATAHIDAAKKEITVLPASSGHKAPAPVPAAYMAAQTPRPPLVPVSAGMSSLPPVTVQEVVPVAAIPPTMTAQPAAISAVLDPEAVNVWQAERGMTLRRILEDWSMRAGVELFWSSDFDFPLSSSVRISGTFEDAVQTLLNGLRDAQPRPVGRLHPNLPEGPSVLVIETKHMIE